MRIHTDHNGLAVNAIRTLADGTPVEGHLYQVLAGPLTSTIQFQQGPVKDKGVNGLTNEALLAILIHRTRHLDSVFASEENKRAIAHMEDALANLEARTARRITRGVEGTQQA